MIQGYPARASVAPGERLVLHVSTDAPRFRVAFHRWGEGFIRMQESGWLSGKYAAPRGAAEDWQWPAYAFTIPQDWPSAVYVAHLIEPEAAVLGAAMESAAILFVVRGAGQSRLLYKIPLATYHAYNCSGGGCFYVNPPRSLTPPGARVSLQRPGGGIGGQTWGALDYYDLNSPRQTFAHWDARFIRWLLREGFAPEFCTDSDLHEDSALCDRHRLLLSVGHDEYWSEAMRDRVEAFVAGGGNAAFFGANLCWWRIHVVDEGRAMVCHQGGPQGAHDHWWPPTGANRPEDSLTGVSYRHGGGWWDGPRSTAGFIVQDAEHWAFAGTGLRRGEAFGQDSAPPLVGYECDGAPLASFDSESGIAVLAPDAQDTGTPPGFRILAAGLLDGGWQERPPRERHAADAGIHSATMGMYSHGGTVFTAGTTDWAQVLGQDRRVDIITRNVIERLLC
ncbi:N,N-dimethylformamidase beta subunit family domain-containing protein [Noviherbaspirillum massiliense]|uniref:N,N-dimethylformamidase beta subunit family domain-containing protein n=1 Tax=Noviherbaspirillum massiliense TaxID=1465823 RepID=UPI0002FC61B4|nr:N,N-dimethylformamidase beta subunit family domain-containing protein [Noviherbaspirillum massiliense]